MNATIQKNSAKRNYLKRLIKKYTRSATGKLGLAFLLFAAVCVGSGIFFASTVVALCGLGFAFWGALLLLIKPVSYVKGNLVDSSVLPLLTNLDKLVTRLNLQGKAVYMPPKSLGSIKENVLFIPAREASALPTLQEITAEKVNAEQKGFCVMPPGQGLFELCEKEGGVIFARATFDDLQSMLRPLLVEKLEVAEDFKMSSEGDKVDVQVEGPFCANACVEVGKLTHICGNLGCALCSAIACILSNSTGKAVSIEKTTQTKDGAIETSYRLFDV